MNECRAPPKSEVNRILSHQPYVSIRKIPKWLMEYYDEKYSTKFECQITEKRIRVEENQFVEKDIKLPRKKPLLRPSISHSSYIYSSSSSRQYPFRDDPLKIPIKNHNLPPSNCKTTSLISGEGDKVVTEGNLNEVVIKTKAKLKFTPIGLLTTDDEVPICPPFHRLASKEKVDVARRQTNEAVKNYSERKLIRKKDNSLQKLPTSYKNKKLTSSVDGIQIDSQRDFGGMAPGEEVKKTAAKTSGLKAKRSKAAIKAEITSRKKQKMLNFKSESGSPEKQSNSFNTNLKTAEDLISKDFVIDHFSKAGSSKTLHPEENEIGPNGWQSSIADKTIKFNIPIPISWSSCIRSNQIEKEQTIEEFLNEGRRNPKSSLAEANWSDSILHKTVCQNDENDIVETAFVSSKTVEKYFDNTKSIDNLFLKQEPIEEDEDCSNQEQNVYPVLNIKEEDTRTAPVKIKREEEENEKRKRFKIFSKVRTIRHECENGFTQINIIDDDEEDVGVKVQSKENAKKKISEEAEKEEVEEKSCMVVFNYEKEQEIESVEYESAAMEPAVFQSEDNFVEEKCDSRLIESILLESEKNLVWSSPDSPVELNVVEEENETDEVNENIASDLGVLESSEDRLNLNQSRDVTQSKVEFSNSETVHNNGSEIEDGKTRDLVKEATNIETINEAMISKETQLFPNSIKDNKDDGRSWTTKESNLKKVDSFEEFDKDSKRKGQSAKRKFEILKALNNFHKFQRIIRAFFHYMDCQKSLLSNRTIKCLTNILGKVLYYKQEVIKNYELLQNIDKMEEYFEGVKSSFDGYEKDVETAIIFVSARFSEAVSTTIEKPITQPITRTNPRAVSRTVSKAAFRGIPQKGLQAILRTFHRRDDKTRDVIVVFDQNKTPIQKTTNQKAPRTLSSQRESSSSVFIQQTESPKTTVKQPCIVKSLPIVYLLPAGQQQTVTKQPLPSAHKRFIVRISTASQHTLKSQPSSTSGQRLQISSHYLLSHCQVPRLSSTGGMKHRLKILKKI